MLPGVPGRTIQGTNVLMPQHPFYAPSTPVYASGSRTHMSMSSPSTLDVLLIKQDNYALKVQLRDTQEREQEMRQEILRLNQVNISLMQRLQIIERH